MHPKPQIAGTSLFTENGTLLLTDYKHWIKTMMTGFFYKRIK
jgi:hypothetical protein